MKASRLISIGIVAGMTIAALAQQKISSGTDHAAVQIKQKGPVVLPDNLVRERLAAQPASSPTGQATTAGLPLFLFGGGTIVGTLPTDPSTTTIQVDVVPVVLNITQGGMLYSFSPTQGDAGCLPINFTAFSLFAGSPFFENVPITMNGVSEGTTQYLDAFQRAELAYVVPNHHTMLSGVGFPPLTINLSVPAGGNSTAKVFDAQDLGRGPQCGNNSGSVNLQNKFPVVNFTTIDSSLRSYISARGTQIQPSHLVFFLMYNSGISNGDATDFVHKCCFLGYHDSYTRNVNDPGQTYAIAEFEGRNQTFFPGFADVSVISHELAEWANDPSGANPVPAWGNIGQVTGCQTNLEVGDPLSGTLAPSITFGAFTFHFQELAFLSWFVGDRPSQGVGGKYSSNGTFFGYAQPCPPGGTF